MENPFLYLRRHNTVLVMRTVYSFSTLSTVLLAICNLVLLFTADIFTLIKLALYSQARYSNFFGTYSSQIQFMAKRIVNTVIRSIKHILRSRKTDYSASKEHILKEYHLSWRNRNTSSFLTDILVYLNNYEHPG